MRARTESEDIFDRFAKELEEWSADGSVPAMGDQDTRYYLELQKARLEAWKVKMVYKLTPRGAFAERRPTVTWNGAKYTNRMAWGTFRREVSFYQGEKKLFSRADNEIFYQIITWLNRSGNFGEVSYCCPSCGAMSRVKELLDGCPYCHTRFVISDLFPKMTNFYFLRDSGMSSEEMNTRLKKWMGTGAVVFTVAGITFQLWNNISSGNTDMGQLIYQMTSVLCMPVFGGILGYMALSIRLLVGLFKEAFQVTPMLLRTIGVKKRLTRLMQQYDPTFSYDYFVGQVLSLLKIVLYSRDLQNTAACEGMWENRFAWDILDAVFAGAIALNGFRMQGPYGYLDLDVYMRDIHHNGKRIHETNDVFRVHLCKNMMRPADKGFSIKRVQCRGCGGSFDAAVMRYCPYCGKAYDMKEDDWVVTGVWKR